jgi:glycosyltransferase involved in cell wall biosynthesis
MLTTIHGFSSPSILPVYERYNARSGYVAISEADRHPSLDYLATIHHGIDTHRFPRELAVGSYLLFFGRIHPDKGTVEAIDVAAELGLPLLLAGSFRTGPTSRNWSRCGSTASGCASSEPSGRWSAPTCSAAPARCCT